MLRTWSLMVAVALGWGAAATSPAAAQSDTPKAVPAFWEALNDPVLDRLMEEALRGSPELHVASARREEAGAARLGAALELAPVVSAQAGYTRRRLASATLPGLPPGGLPDEDLWDSALLLSWELDPFGRLRGDLRARGALLGAVEEGERSTRVALAGQVVRAYVDLRGAQGQLAVARRNAENQRRTLEVTRTRLEAGRGTEFDTERAVAQLGFTLAAIPALEARAVAARQRLFTLAGLPSAELMAGLNAEAPLPELPDSLPPVAAADVIREHPDVLGARGELEASRALVGSARADYLPRVSVTAAAGYTAGTVDAFGNRGTFNYTVGPVVSWAAFDLGRVKARVNQAEAREVAAAARYEQAVLRAQEELQTADAGYRGARSRLAHLRDAAAASERAAQLAALRYQGGIADFLQVLDAERTMLAAQDLLAQAETQAAEAYVALFEARGEAWTEIPD